MLIFLLRKEKCIDWKATLLYPSSMISFMYASLSWWTMWYGFNMSVLKPITWICMAETHLKIKDHKSSNDCGKGPKIGYNNLRTIEKLI